MSGVSDEMVEAVAEAIWKEDGYDLNADPDGRYSRELRPVFMKQARAALKVVELLIRADERETWTAQIRLYGWPTNWPRVNVESNPEICGGRWNCSLPKGHNMGQADVPENHQTICECGGVIVTGGWFECLNDRCNDPRPRNQPVSLYDEIYLETPDDAELPRPDWEEQLVPSGEPSYLTSRQVVDLINDSIERHCASRCQTNPEPSRKGADRTWEATLPCPDCGNMTVFGYNYVNQDDKMMHTHYVCRFWASPEDKSVYMDPDYDSGANRCGWHGWSVPGWDK